MRIGCRDGGAVLVVRDVAVADLSPAGTQFEEVEALILQGFHPSLFREGPACADRWEPAEAMALGKLARTVKAHGGIHHVALLEVPAQTCEVRHRTRFVVGRTAGSQSVGRRGCRTVAHIGVLPIVETFFQVSVAGTYIRAAVAARLLSEQGTHGMLAHLPVVLCGIGPCEGQAMVHVLARACARIIIGIEAQVIERREAAVFAGAIDCAKDGAYLEAVQWSKLSIDVCVERSGARLVVRIEHHRGVGVAVAIVPVRGRCVVVGHIVGVVVAVDGMDGRNAECTTQGVVVGIAHADTVRDAIDERYLLAHLQEVLLAPFQHLVVGVDTEVVALVVRDVLAACNAFLVHVGER